MIVTSYQVCKSVVLTARKERQVSDKSLLNDPRAYNELLRPCVSPWRKEFWNLSMKDIKKVRMNWTCNYLPRVDALSTGTRCFSLFFKTFYKSRSCAIGLGAVLTWEEFVKRDLKDWSITNELASHRWES
jgi:hypothetical protein